jgi:hypothetical protein
LKRYNYVAETTFNRKSKHINQLNFETETEKEREGGREGGAQRKCNGYLIIIRILYTTNDIEVKLIPYIIKATNVLPFDIRDSRESFSFR